MHTAIVILNWNTKTQLEEYLPKVLAWSEDAEVIVADNGSSDGSVKMLSEKFPGVRTISLGENYGYAGGYNRALARISGEGYNYYLLLNSDVEVTRHWLSPLREWMDNHPDCGACGPKLLSMRQREYFEYAGAAGGLMDKFGYTFCRGRLLGTCEKDYGQYDTPENVFWAGGACLMLRAEVFEQLGGFDGRFFAHMEEVDLCWRMQLEGWKVCVVPQSVVYHLGGGTLPQSSPWKLKLNYRNSLLMLANNLAKTLSLKLPAKKARRKATLRIRQRKYLDGLSAAIYLLGLKFRRFAAVIKAHKEYKRMVLQPGLEEIEAYRRLMSAKVKLRGMYEGSIVPKAVFSKKHTFKQMHKPHNPCV